MKDNKFQELIDLTISSKEYYYEFLEALEEEYKRRFKNYPSEVDDDAFIDTFHQKQGNKMSVEDLTMYAKRRIK